MDELRAFTPTRPFAQSRIRVHENYQTNEELFHRQLSSPNQTVRFGSVRLVRHLGNPRIKTESDFLPFIGGLSYQAIAVQGNSEGEGMSLASDSKFCRTVNA